MNIVFDSSSDIYSATFVQYSSSGSELARTPISGNGTVTVQTQTANIRIIVSSSVDTSTSKWKSSNSGTWYTLSNDNKILPTGSNWPTTITLILKSSSSGGGGSTTTYYRCYDVTNDTYIDSLSSTTESSFLRPTWSEYTYIGYGQGASLTAAKNQYANNNYYTSTVCTPSYSYVVFFYSSNSGGGGSTTTYSWDCYDLTADKYISGYEHTGVTSSTITRPSISGYTYQGYVYYDSWSKCVSAGKSGNYDGTGTSCSSHNSSNPYVVFFYTKDVTYYYYGDYDVTNQSFLREFQATSSTNRAYGGSYNGYTYKGYAWNGTEDSCIRQAKQKTYDDTSTSYNGTGTYVLFCYEEAPYQCKCYDQTTNNWIDGGTMSSSSTSITRPDLLNQGYTYQGYCYGNDFNTLATATTYNGTGITCSSLNSSNNKVVFFYKRGWQNPNLSRTHSLSTSGTITGYNLTAYYFKATYLQITIPANTAMIFKTTLGSNYGNYDSYGQIFKSNPANYGNLNSTQGFQAIKTLVPIDTDDDGAGSRDCQLSYVNNTSSSVTIYIVVNPLSYQAITSTKSISYEITSTQSYYVINYYNNNGTTLLGTQGYLSGITKIMSPTITRVNNYSFNGWSKNTNSNTFTIQDGNIITISNNINLYGVFAFILQFTANGGEGDINSIAYYDNIDRTITLPGAQSGIYKSTDYDNNITQISINRYNNNGKIEFTDYCELDSGIAYSLKEWNTTSTGSGTIFNLNTSYQLSAMQLLHSGANLLYAIWENISFTNQVRTPAKICISPNEQYLEGYTFLGYATNKNSTNIQYAINQEYTISTTTEINLYPVFKRKFYFGKNKEWKECKLYYGTNNEWKEITINKGIGGKWV